MDNMGKPTEAFDYITVGGGAPDLSNWINQYYPVETQNRTLSDIFYADPIMRVLCYQHRPMNVTRYFVRHVTDEHPSLAIKIRNVYMLGLTAIGDLLRKRGSGYTNTAASTWHPRRALGLRGTSGGLDMQNLTIGSMGYGVRYPVGVSGLKLDLTYFASPFGGFFYHCSFDDIAATARRLLPFSGQYFQRDAGSLGIYGYHTLEGLYVGDNIISYTMKNIFFQSYPVWRHMAIPSSIGVRIERADPASSHDLHIRVTGLSRVLIDGLDYGSSKPQWSGSVSGSIIRSTATRYDTNVIIGGVNYADQQRYLSPYAHGPFGGLMQAFEGNMAVYSPGLFHSQGKALSNLMIDYGANFENLIQSPQFIELIESVFLKSPQLFESIFTDVNASLAGRVKGLVDFITGHQLAYEFATAPTIRAVQKLLNRLLDFREGEGSFTLEGEDFTSRPLSFQRAVLQGAPTYLGLLNAKVRWYKIVFRTTARTSLSASNAAKAILMNDPIAMIGGYPTPSSIWESLGGSFAVDWFTAVGPMIKDQEAYWRSPSIPLRMGHTVHVRFDYNDGRRFNNFWRSVESNLPIDPPGDTWLPVGDLPSVAIPFGIQQLFRISG